MPITTLNSQAIPADVIQSSDLDYPLTDFSSTGIDDNATSTAITIDSSERVGIKTTSLNANLEISGNSTTGGEDVVQWNNSNGVNKGMLQLSSTGGGQIQLRDAGNTVDVQISSTTDSYFNGGNVGIGTTSPAETLHVENASNNAILLNAPANRYNSIGFQSAGTDKWWLGRADSDQIAGDAFFIGADAGNATDAGGLSAKLVINSSGNVGIGDNAPATNVSVIGTLRVGNAAGVGATSGVQILTSITAGYIGKLETTDDAFLMTTNSTARDITFGTTATEIMRVDCGTSRVGIGTTSPSRTLDIKSANPLNINTTSNNHIHFQVNDVTTGQYVSTSSLPHQLCDSTGAVPRLVVDSSGNVGIGTTSPAYKLSVHADAVGTTYPLKIENGNATSGNGVALLFTHRAHSGDNQGSIEYVGAGANNTNSMLFKTEANGVNGMAERMRINASGNVGIGTTDIGARLSVRSAASASITNVLDVGNAQNAAGTGHGAMIRLHCTTDENRGVAIASSSSTNYATDNNMLFYTSASSTLTERMRIDSSGNLLVGCTSAMGGGGSDGINGFGAQGSGGGRFVAIQNTTDANLYIAKNSGYTSSNFIFFYAAGTKVGSIYTNGTATTYATTSDQRLKENIVDAPAGNIDDIRVRSFDWKADGSHQTYGMVAQELVDVVPEAVAQGETEDDMWGVDYSKLVPMMIKEIQDLKAEVAALKGA